MFRRLSSFVLILSLTVLVGVKDLALGFCLCEETLFLGKDPCAVQATHDCGDCCGHDESEKTPCDDCVVSVQLEVEDYLWTSDSFAPQAPLFREEERVFTAIVANFSSIDLVAYTNYEPPPPPGCPLLIRQRRLLL